MKKTFLLTTLLALGITTQAEADARRWDFRQWSAETVANLEAGAFANTSTNVPTSGWSDVEKAAGTAPTDLSNKNCYWEVAAQGSASGSVLTANGIAVKETEGLLYVNTTSRSLAIAVNYQGPLADGFGPYQGASYLWLGSSKKNYFVIPNVEVGTKIRMGIESHKTTDARGIELYVYTSENQRGTRILGEDGADAPASPTTYEDQVWQVQEGLTDTPNADGTYNLVLYNTNGCHLYYITVGEESEFVPEEVSVAYLYDSTYGTTTTGFGWGVNGGLDSDPIFSTLQSYTTTAIDFSQLTLTTSELCDSLLSYDVVVLSEAVGSGNTYAKALVEIVNKVPMLNLKSFMYKKGVWTWGAGANPAPKATTIQVSEDYRDSELFADMNMDDEGNVTLFELDDVSTLAGGNLVQAYTASEGSIIASDEVIATAGGLNAIHAHGTKNQYLLIPLSSDNLNYLGGDAQMLIYNAISLLAKTKSKVQNAAAPIIAQTQADGETTVVLSCSTSGSTIFYTTDGNDPTEASTRYEGDTLRFTTDGIVLKAFATAHGYNPSAIASATISVRSRLAAPVISAENLDGQTILTLTQSADAPIYFSFTGVTTAATAAAYVEPISVREPGTIYAFAASETALPSELASLDFTVAGIPAVVDTLAHFTANENDWYTNSVLSVDTLKSGGASAIYYFGKSAWTYFSDEISSVEAVLDVDGNPVKCVDGVTDSLNIVYLPDPTALRTITSTADPQWIVKTQGQVITGETQLLPDPGVGINGAVGRYADHVLDGIGGAPTRGTIDFGAKRSGEPYSMSIETTGTFSGEFDVVAYLGNGSTGTPYIGIQTSLDGKQWTTADTLNFSTNQRYWKKTRTHIVTDEPLYVRVAQIGGSSKAQLYDIYIIRTSGTSGIENIIRNSEPAAHLRIEGPAYDLQGRRTNASRGLQIRSGRVVLIK